MDLAFFHGRLAISLILYLLLLAVWGLFGYVRGGRVSGGYLGALVIAEAVLVVQAALGVALLLAGRQPGTWLHIAYGVLPALSLPAAHGIARGRPDRSAQLIYALASVFVFGLVLRAFTTGG